MAKEIKVKIEDTTPLLMNRFREASISGKSKRRTGVMTDAELTDKLYLNSDGTPYIPNTYFKGALVESGKNFKIAGKGKATFSKLIGSTVMVEPEAIALDGEWVKYSIAGVNPNTRGRMMIHRPRFDKWACEFRIVLQDEGIDIASLKEILDYAGAYVGVGDWRPQKKGMFGKFIVTEFKEIK